MEDENMRSNAAELFGVSEEDANVAVKVMKHSVETSRTTDSVADDLDLRNAGFLAFKAFMFGRFVERNERSANRSGDKIEMLMKLREIVGEKLFEEAFRAAIKSRYEDMPQKKKDEIFGKSAKKGGK